MYCFRKILPLFILLFLYRPVFPEKTEPTLAVSLIPADIREGSDAVIRYSNTTMTINSEKKIIFHYHYAVTVFNKNGAYHAFFHEEYDKMSHVGHVSGVAYDPTGRRIKKIGNSDLKDYSAVPNGTLYQDDRIKIFIPDIHSYPVTLAYEYDMEYNGMVTYPSWIPQSSYRVGVEKASFRIIAGKKDLPRFMSKNLDDPELSKEKDQHIILWTVSNLKPVRSEPLEGDMTDRIPVLYLAPCHFSYAKTQGDMSSWGGIGRWIAALNKGRQVLPEETIIKIAELTHGLKTMEGKAEAVYHYMQKHTRYVSVQLGIGGFQPYPASYVDKNGYGDCKALSNYTCALMNAAGIDARYVLIKAGNAADDILTRFPSNQFNHVIVCIPREKDSLWLECTNQKQPFGFLGKLTADRHALMITGDSGVLVHTPVYTRKENTQYRHATVKIARSGEATAEIHTCYRGLQYDNVSTPLYLKGEEQKKWYYRYLDIPDFSIQNIHLVNHPDDRPVPSFEEDLDITLKKYLILGGKRGFLPVNLMNKISYIPKQLTQRESDIVLTFAFTDADTITYLLPEKLEVEYAPSPVHFQSEFGEYESSVTVNGHQVTYIRRISLEKGKYSKDKFDEFAAFRKKIVQADRKKVLIKL